MIFESVIEWIREAETDLWNNAIRMFGGKVKWRFKIDMQPVC